ncbi:HNH endonuclease [Desulfovibrio sp. OttesenSCG-928-A18]|nr:HNH endonuclease [Desulfovibrio sp. OttesenSCG-928-A18]
MRDNDFMQQWPAFRAWLQENGCQILEPTNPYEVVRFTTPDGIGIVYRKEGGRISKMTGCSQSLFWAWKEGRKFEFAMRTPREKRRDKKRDQLIQKIAKRDGWSCMFCGNTLDRETATIEHIVALASRGMEHIANMTLACEDCNKQVGHMSARQKFEHALKRRRGE